MVFLALIFYQRLGSFSMHLFGESNIIHIPHGYADYQFYVNNRGLFNVINTLAEGGVLDARYRDHELSGRYKGTRECHIEPDWLLVYEIRENVLVLMLYRLGTHSKLFKK